MNQEEAVSILQAMTGLGEVEARGYLEMCGGDVSQAIELCADLGGGSAPAEASMSMHGEWSEVHEIVFGNCAVPDSWRCQGCEVSSTSEAIVYTQEMNGPCGALAAMNALVQLEVFEKPQISAEDALRLAIGWVLVRCAVVKVKLAAGERCSDCIDLRICTAQWKEASFSIRTERYFSVAEWLASSQLREAAAAMRERGGLVLVLYSAVATRGIVQVGAEANQDDGLPLVSAPYAFCGPELIDLLLCGAARGNFFVSKEHIVNKAQHNTIITSLDDRERGSIGFLSIDESTGRIVCDELKRPHFPIFVLHGGDHFSLLFGNPSQTLWYHWNGLEPNRKLSLLRLRNSCKPDDPSPPPIARYKVRPGEIESVVQRKNPKQWYRDNSYEISLVTPDFAADDPTPPRTEDTATRLSSSLTTKLPDTFDFGPEPTSTPWRCLKCYHSRFQTGHFGLNHSLQACSVCGTGLRDSRGHPNWSIWHTYTELPLSTQRRIDRSYAPKLLSVLRTRWLDVEVDLYLSTASMSMQDEASDQACTWFALGHPGIQPKASPVL